MINGDADRRAVATQYRVDVLRWDTDFNTEPYAPSRLRYFTFYNSPLTTDVEDESTC